MNYYLDIVKKFDNFKGRATRKEYWLFYLITMAIMSGASMLSKAAGSGVGQLLLTCLILLILIPWLAVTVRRFHDAGYSAWFILIPVFSMAVLFFDSQRGTNKYGPNPKGVEVPLTPPTPLESATKAVKHIQKVFYVVGAINLLGAIFVFTADNFYFSPNLIGIVFGLAILFLGWSLSKSYKQVVPKAAIVLSIILLISNILYFIYIKASIVGFIFPVALLIMSKQARQAIKVLESSKT